MTSNWTVAGSRILGNVALDGLRCWDALNATAASDSGFRRCQRASDVVRRRWNVEKGVEVDDETVLAAKTACGGLERRDGRRTGRRDGLNRRGTGFRRCRRTCTARWTTRRTGTARYRTSTLSEGWRRSRRGGLVGQRRKNSIKSPNVVARRKIFIGRPVYYFTDEVPQQT